MATADFYIVYVKRIAGVTYDDVEEKMNLANDWYRLKNDIWVIYSTSDPEKWYERLSPLVKDGGNVFICQLNVSRRQGWMPKGFWNWLDQDKDE